ncbi:MAG: Lrp/AsnC family transcriptional regulator [Candidatus Sphingomonas colombiensis]|nr:Lrp/AsnC family transcriptional regulator [Sphingomonas sp.]WEK42008.1 MAG: Lrp/AsnC family transcriptional regulator [Sphingomonas sp.]
MSSIAEEHRFESLPTEDRKELDSFDMRILRELTIDGRITWRELAERIGRSLTPTLRRVRQLEENGFIRGYTACLDETRLSGPMVVFITVRLERQISKVMDAFEADVAELPEIMSAFLMTGGSDYLLRAVVRDLEHYRELIETITRIDNVGRIQSNIALKSFVNRTASLPFRASSQRAAR